MLDILFEEDMELQDELEDLDGLNDDADDIIISSIDHRYEDANKEELFANDEEPGEDGLTDEERNSILIDYLDSDIEDDIFEDDDEDEDLIDDDDLDDEF